ncbi:hypothetical protein HPG69_011169 [Diceros bicornis minor]|uniref:Uncharacterized protein n=1 Tax=Diceros bicornis minor TaxID=77932 RepID=A0A7J7EHU1_DICBM|nr:hypothetical protein HPG69_011169 [Diceros bicornis minor]
MSLFLVALPVASVAEARLHGLEPREAPSKRSLQPHRGLDTAFNPGLSHALKQKTLVIGVRELPDSQMSLWRCRSRASTGQRLSIVYPFKTSVQSLRFSENPKSSGKYRALFLGTLEEASTCLSSSRGCPAELCQRRLLPRCVLAKGLSCCSQADSGWAAWPCGATHQTQTQAPLGLLGLLRKNWPPVQRALPPLQSGLGWTLAVPVEVAPGTRSRDLLAGLWGWPPRAGTSGCAGREAHQGAGKDTMSACSWKESPASTLLVAPKCLVNKRAAPLCLAVICDLCLWGQRPGAQGLGEPATLLWKMNLLRALKFLGPDPKLCAIVGAGDPAPPQDSWVGSPLHPSCFHISAEIEAFGSFIIGSMLFDICG